MGRSSNVPPQFNMDIQNCYRLYLKMTSMSCPVTLLIKPSMRQQIRGYSTCREILFFTWMVRRLENSLGKITPQKNQDFEV